MILKDDDLILRPFTADDAVPMTLLANNEKISRNLRDGFPHPYTLADAEQFLRFAMSVNPASLFAIENRGEYCGNCGLMPGDDVYRCSAEIGYFIGEPFWNKGLATRAVKLLVRYGFDELGLARIHTGIFEYNPASMRVLEKCGFTKDGVFRKSVIKMGKIWDEHRYSIVHDINQNSIFRF